MNIHVGNLAPEVTDRELQDLFASCGKVETVEIITNRRTGEPLGYAFVVMATDEEGMKAITTLNGATLQGKVIAVTKANRPQGRRRTFRDKPKFR